MSKFIQFNVQNAGTAQPAEPIAPILVNVEDISGYSAVGAAAAGKTLLINLIGRTARTAGTDLLTLTFSTSTLTAGGAVAPATVDGQPNPFIQALVSAISQVVPSNVAVYQLGNDGSTAAAAPNGVQMYINSAVFS